MNQNETQWDKLLKIKTTGRDDSNSDQYRYPYEPTSYMVLERLANSGLIRKNKIVTVAPADIISVYKGESGHLMQEKINEARGGVLFIDEAYSLYRGKDDAFGLEAIDTLVKGMEDHRDDLVVILAGYSKEMEEL